MTGHGSVSTHFQGSSTITFTMPLRNVIYDATVCVHVTRAATPGALDN